MVHRLSLICLYLIVMPIKWVLRGFFSWAGFQFFVVWQLQDQFPQYRRALFPLWWILYAIPTDAEAALHILQKRSAQIRPVLLRHDSSRESVNLKDDNSVYSFLMKRDRSHSSLLQRGSSSSGGESKIPGGIEADRWRQWRDRVTKSSRATAVRLRRVS